MGRIPLAIVLISILAVRAASEEVELSRSGIPIALVTVPAGGGNYDLNVIRDGVKPGLVIGEGLGDSLQQYDTYDGANAATQTEDWIGYGFDCTYGFTRLVFQEGKHFGNGGWFDPPENLLVQVQDPATSEWNEAPGTWDPPYPGRLTAGQIVAFETFTWLPDGPTSGTGIRIYGTPGGGVTDAFISCAELEVYSEVDGVAPKIALTYGPTGGPPPLDVSFDASASKGEGLTFNWEFPDGTIETASNFTHTFDAAGNYRVRLTISSLVASCTMGDIRTVDISVGSGLKNLGRPIALVTGPLGGGTRDINVIRDDVRPAVLIGENAGDSLQQYDTYDGANVDSFSEDWIGYEFDTSYDIQTVVFQEGKQFGNGGWFDPPDLLVVQMKDPGTGEWAEVPGLWDPPYPGRLTNGQITVFETFTWTGDAPVATTGVRIYGKPGGGGVEPFISCAELEVFTPPGAEVTRSADKEIYAFGDTIEVTLDIVMESGDSISIDEGVPPGATVTDISDGGSQTGDIIHWDLAGIDAAKITYRIIAPACAVQVIYDSSSWIAGFSRGGMEGTKVLSLAMGSGSLGEWTSTDFTAPESGALPLAAQEILVKGTGDGVKSLGQKDSLRFIDRPASDDFEITARIDCFDDPGGKGQAGVMVRDVLQESSAQAFLYITKPGTAGAEAAISALFRKATATPAGRNSSVILTNKDVIALPVWLRLRREVSGDDGKTYIFFERSEDGTTFEEIGKKENIPTIFDLKADVFVGLGVSGGGAGASSATFGGVSGPDFPLGGDPLQAPSGLGVIAGDGKVTLSWSAPAAGPAPEAYGIYRDGLFLVQVPASPLSYDDTGIEAGNRYCYAVASRKGAEESSKTDPACADVAGSPRFRRGDADGSGKLDLTDAIFTLTFQFMGGEAPKCMDATDADDSGSLDLTDAIFSLTFQFMGGPAPPAPGSTVCGPDTTTAAGQKWNSADCVYTTCQ